MTEREVVEIIRKHFESLFPKTCNNCGRTFGTLRAYILTTERRGAARSHDADLGEWDTNAPLGSQALANCPCGSTLALSTDGMVLSQRQALLGWVKDETERRGVSPTELLEYLRDQLRRQILAEEL
jgi:hypothetical protein